MLSCLGIRCRRIAASGLTLALLSGVGSPAAEPVALEANIAAEVTQLIESLDAANFATRTRAVDRLAQLSLRKDLATPLAAEFHRRLLSAETSFEVRSQLERLSHDLPVVRPPLPEDLSDTELAGLFDYLQGDSHSARHGAHERLKWLSGNTQLALRIMRSAKNRLADPEVASDSRRLLRRTWRDARVRWLLSSPADVRLPAVESAVWQRWVDDWSTEGDEFSDRVRRGSARRELFDLLARDEYVEPVRAFARAQLGAETDGVRVARLERLLAWTVPSMVAEVWVDRGHRTIQHLLIDVPQIPEMAARATHFDRIDDRQAHCVSGTNLTPGSYPVGVAIPHPNPRNNMAMMFHLINLPTPRRQMVYRYYSRLPEAERLAAISQRTVDAWLAEKHRLSEADQVMLGQLDRHIVSRFVGPYFQAVPDHPFAAIEGVRLAGSEHRAICVELAKWGTHEAVPALERAERQNTLADAGASRFHLAWVAALAIAQRDPWAEVDPWLAGLVGNETPLASGVDPAPELGATAAAILLERHQTSPQLMGLEHVNEAATIGLGVTPFRFVSPEARKEVEAWWKRLPLAPAG